jgi:hypothetical protein
MTDSFDFGSRDNLWTVEADSGIIFDVKGTVASVTLNFDSGSTADRLMLFQFRNFIQDWSVNEGGSITVSPSLNVGERYEFLAEDNSSSFNENRLPEFRDTLPQSGDLVDVVRGRYDAGNINDNAYHFQSVTFSPPLSQPSAPSNISIGSFDSQSLNLVIDAPTDWGGEVGSYFIRQKKDNSGYSNPAGGPQTVSGSTGTKTVSYDVTPGSSYEYRVRAENSAGDSPFSYSSTVSISFSITIDGQTVSGLTISQDDVVDSVIDGS